MQMAPAIHRPARNRWPRKCEAIMPQATPSTSSLISIIVVEITGEAAVPLDVFATGNDDLATPFTSSITAATAQANELVLAFEFDNRAAGSAIAWGNSYTSLVDLANTAAISAAAAKLNVTSIGTQQSSFTNADTTDAVTWIATFKESSGAAYIQYGQGCL